MTITQSLSPQFEAKTTPFKISAVVHFIIEVHQFIVELVSKVILTIGFELELIMVSQID